MYQSKQVAYLGKVISWSWCACPNEDHHATPPSQNLVDRENNRNDMAPVPCRQSTTKSLERRRLERDLILCYSLFHGICEIRLLLKTGVSVTRGNSCKLVKTSCNTNAAKYFYTNRTVLAWNSLSDTVVTASSVNAFRKQLNAVNLEKFLIVG